MLSNLGSYITHRVYDELLSILRTDIGQQRTYKVFRKYRLLFLLPVLTDREKLITWYPYVAEKLNFAKYKKKNERNNIRTVYVKINYFITLWFFE